MTDWSQVVQEHGPIVWKTVYRLLANEADAADCFQNTLVSALELSRKEAVRSWPAVFERLATARALERLRQRHREPGRLRGPSECRKLHPKGAEPGRTAEEAERAEHLRVALAELPPRQAEAFCLASLEGRSYRQIAEQLGLTVNHVGVLLNRARTSLRKRLRAHRPPGAAERFHREV